MTEITLDELFPYIQIAFDGDNDLYRYHISDSDFAQHTYDEICKTAAMIPLTYYKVGEYGFTVTSPGLLYSFGINHQYRTKEFLENWMGEIKNLLITFDCCLHSKNERAIAHLLKQGMKIKEYVTILTI